MSDCFMPTLGAAQIVGFLKKENINCKLYDCSAELCDYLLANYDVENKAVAAIINNANSSYEKYKMLLNWISKKEIYEVSTDRFRYPIRGNVEIMKNFLESETLFSNILKHIPIVKTIAQESDFVGISISYPSQWLLGLLLAKTIKNENKDLKIVLGGAFFNEDIEFTLAWMKELAFVDYIVSGIGETVLKELLTDGDFESIKGINITNVDSRFFIDARNIECDELVYCPDFSDIDFEKYPSQQKFIPYMIRSRCYYGNCNFCDGDRSLCGIRNKDVSKAFSSISEICKITGIRNVYLVDAALAPIDFIKIANGLDLNINWVANARFEKALLDKNLLLNIRNKGCRMLRFGLESGSQHVLDLMKKGTSIEVAQEVLHNAYDVGIKNHVYIMFGYLGETTQNREETLDFLEANKAYISSYGISMFEPLPGTPVYCEVEAILESQGKHHITEDDVFNYIYSSEEVVREVMSCVDRAKRILGKNTQFNFSNQSDSGVSLKYTGTSLFEYYLDEILVSNYMLMSKKCYDTISAPLSKRINISLSTEGPAEVRVIYDISNDVEIFINAPSWLIDQMVAFGKNPSSEFFNNQRGVLSETQIEMCEEMVSILARESTFVLNYPHLREKKYFAVV